MPMTLVSTVTLGAGGASQIEWTGIPQTGKDLLVVASLRTDTTAGGTRIRFNATTSGYTNRLLQGNGSSVFSYTNLTNSGFLGDLSNSGDTANTFGSAGTYIANYTSAANKSYSIDAVSENNATAANQWIIAGQWANTAAITTVTLSPQSATAFVQNSTASLYIIS